jgi:hypothetical protein
LPTLDLTFADLRFVCSSFRSFTNKADQYRQSRTRNTVLIENASRDFKAPEIPYRHCRRLYSTDEDYICKVSFTEPLNEDEKLDKGLEDMDDAKSVTSNTSSGKRKRNAGSAFYAVRVGRTPGVYYSWLDCEAQTKGMRSSECELFKVKHDSVY